MNQRPYRLRSSSAGPRSVENERLAQAVKLDRYKELMPGKEERVSTHVVASGDIAEAIELPWGLSSSPHFDTINKQTNPPLNPNHSVPPSLSPVWTSDYGYVESVHWFVFCYTYSYSTLVCQNTENIDISVFFRYFGIFGILNTDVGIGIGIPTHDYRLQRTLIYRIV